jgi:TetR/AcrR family transcriptional regulator
MSPSAAAKAAPPRPRGLARPATQRKLDHLLARAAALIAEKGFGATAIREVGREVGSSLAGMYYYFESKEELLYRIQQRTFASLLEAQEEIASRTGNPEERFRRLLRGHLAFFGRHPHEMKVCTYEIESLKGERYHALEALRRRYYRLLADVVGELMNGPGRSRVDASRSRHVTLFIFGMLNWVFMWHNPSRDRPVEELSEEMLDLVLNGLRPGKKGR